MDYKKIKFVPNSKGDFISVLRKRVKANFQEENKSIYGNIGMVVKTIFMLSLYLVPYFLMIFGVITNPYLIIGMWLLMGLGMSGIGLAIMHDANHGAYSKNKKVNKYLGYVMNLIGASAFNWKVQHNVLHHSFTNIEGVDEDIDPGILMRLSPHAKYYKMHKYQHIYGWFLYSIMTFLWLTSKDFRQLKRYKRLDLIKGQKRTYRSVLIETIFSKIGYYAYALVIPLIFISAPWWIIVLGFISMHLITGLAIGLIFQPAHVMPTTDFPLPDDIGSMENNWAIHQLYTTTNFSPKSKIFSWYVGGLNYQVEHHLFPNICHVHYKRLSKIVKETAQEFNLPYHSQPTFLKAIIEHGKMLKELGKAS
jgi:linoleoyl-CoA desaturase